MHMCPRKYNIYQNVHSNIVLNAPHKIYVHPAKNRRIVGQGNKEPELALCATTEMHPTMLSDKNEA